MNLICKILGHKFKAEVKGKMINYICERCKKNRDIYKKGEKRNPKVKYYSKKDGVMDYTKEAKGRVKKQ